jgi:hypothetical protein
MEIIIHVVPTGGTRHYLPCIKGPAGNEIYRGEYKETALEALEACERRIQAMQDDTFNDIKEGV